MVGWKELGTSRGRSLMPAEHGVPLELQGLDAAFRIGASSGLPGRFVPASEN